MRILYLDIDTLRADHLGCYGYHRNTSPNIDRLAREGVRFDEYYCSDAPCLPSRTALMTGRFGMHTGVVGHGGTTADGRIEGRNRGFFGRLGKESLWMLLKRQGMRTVSISPFAERHGTWSFYAGFDEMYNTGGRGGESAEAITPTVLDWIERNAAQDDWFLHINYWDPHTPYRAPADFGNPFADDPLPTWLTEEVFEGHRQLVGPHKPLNINMFNNATNARFPRYPGELDNMADLRRMIDGYDCGIRYADSHVGQVLAAMGKSGVLDDVVVIVSSDHGENMGELGIYGEHGTADAITHRIPMIVRWPGMRSGHASAGHVDTGLHYNLDLAPTLADVFDVSPAPAWDGASFASALTDGASCGREYLVLSQCCHVCQRSVRFDHWLYMRTYHDGYHLFPGEQLFNLAENPHEQIDLAGRYPGVVREAVYRLAGWHDDMMANTETDSDPLWTVIREGGPFHARGHLGDYCTFLERAGRHAAAAQLRAKHPDEL